MNELIERATAEFKDKMRTITVEKAKNIAIYASILTYLMDEKISEEYCVSLLQKENILDYLYEVYMDNRHNYYDEIKTAIDLDQLMF